MKVNFKQGIISGQDNFISMTDNMVNINADTKAIDITFSHGSSDYLLTETETIVGAWGPFNSGVNYWIYWDINLSTGIRSFGSTQIQPSYGITLPSTPLQNTHFFDVKDKKMKVWNGFQWEEKIRVFAGKVSNGTVLIPNSFGSQVGISGNYISGYILFDDKNSPIKRVNGSASYLLTTEDKVHTQLDRRNGYKIDSLIIDGVAIETIPAFYCITWKGSRQLGIASNVDANQCIGIAVENASKNESVSFITKGFLSNYGNWNWMEPANTPIFVGPTGQITTEVPQTYSLQKLGHIVAPDTIFVNIEELIELDNILPIAPTPTPTPSPQILNSLVNENGDYIINETGDTIEI